MIQEIPPFKELTERCEEKLEQVTTCNVPIEDGYQIFIVGKIEPNENNEVCIY